MSLLCESVRLVYEPVFEHLFSTLIDLGCGHKSPLTALLCQLVYAIDHSVSAIIYEILLELKGQMSVCNDNVLPISCR